MSEAVRLRALAMLMIEQCYSPRLLYHTSAQTRAAKRHASVKGEAACQVSPSQALAVVCRLW